MVKSKTDLSALSSREEKALMKILTDPVRWGEMFLSNRDGTSRQFWEHQKEDLRCKSKNIIHQDGRDVGKSVCIVTDLLHYAFTTKGGNRLVKSDLNVPSDFLDYHQVKAGYRGIRSKIFETETALSIDEFMQKTLHNSLVREG